MKITVKSAIVLFAAMTASTVMAANTNTKETKVYKCTKNGVVTYSQIECSNNAEQVTVELQQGLPDKDYVAPHLKQQKDVDKYLEDSEKTEQRLRHEKRIEQLKRQLAIEFEALKEIRFRTAQAKDEAVKRLSDKYNALIKIEQDAIKALYKQAQGNES